MKSRLCFSIVAILVVIISSFTTGCNKDDSPTSPSNPTQYSLQGNWHLDKIQMVSAPSTGGPSSIMKQALVPFGSISASTAGYMNATVGGALKWMTILSGGWSSLGKFQFVDNQTGWVGSEYSSNSEIKRTNDGGATWNTYYLPTSYYNTPYYFVNGTTGFCAGYENSYNKIWKSTNGGQNWMFISNTSSSANDISFININTGYFIGYNSLYKTTNGGYNWISQSIGTINQASSIKFYASNTQYGWIFGYNSSYQSVVRKTTDGGITWIDMPASNIRYSLYDICVVNTQLLFAFGQDNNYKSQLFKSNDGGNTWSIIQMPVSYPNGMYFTDELNGYLVDNDGMILHTKDGGSNWAFESGGTNEDLNGVYFIDINKGFAAGDNGTIIIPTSIVDTSFVTVTGKITNTALQLITDSGDEVYTAAGNYQINNNLITFVVTSYSGSLGDDRVGTGTFTLTDRLVIDFSFPYNEKWRVEMIR